MASTWTYSGGGSDALSQIRLQLADTDFSNVGDTVPRAQQTALFSDQEYGAFLSIANGDVTVALRAQAQALWTLYAEQPAEAWAEVDQNAFSAQRIGWAQILRQGY